MNKKVREYLKLQDDRIYLDCGDEILVSAQKLPGHKALRLEGGLLRLPVEVFSRLRLEKDTQVALVQRAENLALKRITCQEKPGEWADAVEQESADQIVRTIKTNPEPDALLIKLIDQSRIKFSEIKLGSFLSGRESLETWQARRLMGKSEPGDLRLRDDLIEQQVHGQCPDGSWDGDVMHTTRALKSLRALGVPTEDNVMRQGLDWLLDRPQSEANPGMFFLNDALVDEQRKIIRSRSAGKGERFRQRKSPEIRRVRDVIPTAPDPCGPRIMWPNAITLSLFIECGLEDQPRVQAALEFLKHGNWCECSYQHGLSGSRHLKINTEAALAQLETRCQVEFRFGGLQNPAAPLDRMVTLPRISSSTEKNSFLYGLQLPDHIQPCELITTYGLSQVNDQNMRRLAQAHLWRFAARQRPPSGVFREHALKHVSMFFYLDLFSRYDHLAAQIVLLRALDWVVENQNLDGSWGNGVNQEADTLAVVRAISALKRIFMPVAG